MVFTDDIVLVTESANGLNMRLKSWRKALEDNGLRIFQSKESFRYLGSVIHRSGRIDDDITHQCWPIMKAQANRMEVEELRMLRLTCGKTMLDMIPNRVFRAELEVESIIHKMRKGRMGWFGHVKRRPQTAPVKTVKSFFVDGSRRRGGPKLRWEDRLKQDMKELLLSEDMTSDRIFPLGF
ncbi:hypothetical protein Tco_1395135 [Tanacetum coccineum]